ncbi:MAG: peptidoglycan editing factor PgeF [Janthinobacterium lividum]
MSVPKSAVELESPEAIAVVDDILAGVGLQHGSRASRRNTWAGGERRPVGKKKDAAAKASAEPAEQPQPVTISALRQCEGLVHGFSTRAGGVSRCYRPWLPEGTGDLNLGFTAHDDPDHVRENRRRFLYAIQAQDFQQFALLNQRHTPIIRILAQATEASTDFLQSGALRGDAVMTDLPGVLLTIQTADCVPVLLFDPLKRVVAAFHAGWRGTLARIVERGVGTMRRQYGSDPASLIAAIGPSIGPESYAVGEELQHDFRSQFHYADELFRDVYDSDPIREKYPLLFLTARAPGHSPIGPQLHLDLWEANRRQLLDAGVEAANISITGENTAADTGRFFSYRAEDGFTGRMMSAIGMAE